MSLNTKQREQFVNSVCLRAHSDIEFAISLLADSDDEKSKEQLKRTISNAITYLAHALAVM